MSEQDQRQRDLCNRDRKKGKNLRPIKENKIWLGDM